MSRIGRALDRRVRRRARGRCEYCHSPQSFYRERFQIDHVTARQHGGQTNADNLALCCLECNLRKGPNIAGIDPDTGRVAALFNPRKDSWNDHFAWDGPRLIGLTATGRTTIFVLDLNRSPRVLVRRSLIEEGQFPPKTDRRQRKKRR